MRNRTIRLIAHGSIGGHYVRLRLSNAYGRVPLVLGRVQVALRSKGAEIDAGTQREVSFGGTRSVTIPARATIDSDPVLLEVPPFADIAVSLYLPRQTPATTSHFLAMQSGYVSSGTGDSSGAIKFKVGKTISAWPFLTGIEVIAPNAAGTVAVFGDSTVDGDGSTMNANHRWPDELALALNRDAGSPKFGVLNAGIIGNRLLRQSPREPPSEFGDALGEAGITRFERDALGSPTTNYVIVRIGLNDIGLPGSVAPAADAVTATDVIEGYRTLIRMAHQRGVRIFGTTLSPFEGVDNLAGYYNADKDSVRQQVNTWIRTAGEFDSVIDLDTVLADPRHPSRLLPAFDSGDHLHANDAGNAASAAAVPLALFTARH